jgi:hypothetical protein
MYAMRVWVLLGVIIPSVASALMMLESQNTPVERLLRNTERALSDAASYGIVARLHTLAGERSDGETRRTHLTRAADLFRRADALEPRAVWEHGLAWVLELSGDESAAHHYLNAQARAHRESARLAPLPDFVDRIDRDTRAALDRIADSSIPGDEESKKKKPKPDPKQGKKKPKKKPPDYEMSPVIFGDADSVSALVAPGRTTSFDIAGDGIARRWPWLRPTTGILVWDPSRRGVVSSGRQLFGSVSWWVFWPDGYRALAALDDNNDGWLSGAELDGIAIWRDANSDGISHPGEVTPASVAGVVRIGVRATRGSDGILRSTIVFRDRTLSSFDWMVAPQTTVAKAP